MYKQQQNKINQCWIDKYNEIRHVFLFEQTLVLQTLFHHYDYFFLTIVLWSMVWSGPLWGHPSNTHPLTLKDQDTLHFPGIGRYHDLCSGYSLHPPAHEHDTESSWFYHSTLVTSSRNARYRTASVSQQTLYSATKHGYMLPAFMFKVTKRTWRLSSTTADGAKGNMLPSCYHLRTRARKRTCFIRHNLYAVIVYCCLWLVKWRQIKCFGSVHDSFSSFQWLL